MNLLRFVSHFENYQSFGLFHCLWYLHHETWVFRLYNFGDFVVSLRINGVLSSHQIIPVLNWQFNLLFRGSTKVKLMYGIIPKLCLSDYIKFSLFFSKDSKDCQELSLILLAFQLIKAFNNHIRILLKVNKHILIFLYPLKLPIWACEQEVKIKFSIAGKLNLNVLADSMELSYDNLNSEFFHVFEGLDLVRFLLHPDYKFVFLVVD